MLDDKGVKLTNSAPLSPSWKLGDSGPLDFCAKLTNGMHKLMVMGAASCCDRTSGWLFQVDDGVWKTVTAENLNLWKTQPKQRETDTVVEYGTIRLSAAT